MFLTWYSIYWAKTGNFCNFNSGTYAHCWQKIWNHLSIIKWWAIAHLCGRCFPQNYVNVHFNILHIIWNTMQHKKQSDVLQLRYSQICQLLLQYQSQGLWLLLSNVDECHQQKWWAGSLVSCTAPYTNFLVHQTQRYDAPWLGYSLSDLGYAEKDKESIIYSINIFYKTFNTWGMHRKPHQNYVEIMIISLV